MAKKYKRFATADFDIDPDTIPRIDELLPIRSLSAAYAESKSQKEKELSHLASFREVFSFGSGPNKKVGLTLGIICAILSGCIYPALAFVLSTSFKTLSVPTSDDFLEDIRRMAFIFMGLGAFAFLSMTAQSTLLETAAESMTLSLKTNWFDALLRQDMAYFDIKDVSGTATMISTAGAKYKAGVGRKLGEGVQFFVTFIGGFVYAFYASWQTSLILLAVLPVMSASFLFVVKMNQSQTKRANETYAEAGSIVYMAVSAIRTVFSLNACEKMIQNYVNATERAYQAAASRVALLGLANGTLMGTMFGLRNVVLTLYGAYLLYNQVRNDGCDPSGNADLNPSGSCYPDGAGVFGALMGITIGAAGLPQISVAVEAFTHARVSCQPAINVMNRKVGSDTDEKVANAFVVNGRSRAGNNRRVSMALPKYVINSSSSEGKKPSTVAGTIEFREVSFAYPTRNDNLVFDGFSLSVAAGQTVALVGASGCGKSTIVSLIERFYDPTSGSITIDDIDLRELNVRWLRDQIGLVSQEPVLFARSISENIAYGSPGASQEQIEEAAKLANAHGFITSFPDGYSTHVGDFGSQLSGGQKQRIAISRAILKRPKLLLLDEATSALDSESESVVQAALDNLLESSSLTTIVIAHRLSTVRNADFIAVVENGRVAEQGSHNELMALKGHYFRLVEAQSMSSHTDSSATKGRSIEKKSLVDTTEVASGMMDNAQQAHLALRNVHFAYPTRKRNMVFSGLDLNVKRGETLAIVGPSGCGKSTLVSLIERFYDPISGIIELDGIDLKELNVSWLRNQIGLVQQEPTLFDATILENIRYGNPTATQEEVEEAARRANAFDFITAFPDQFNTYVGERGTQLSGGQKQRIAISRAILKPRQLLLLDEATSSLDSESEHLVQDALDKLMEAKSQTAIVIAHRLSTLRNADRIAVIADGKVKEIGTHEELMSKPNGHFKRLSAFQSLDAGANSEIKSLMAAAANESEEKENIRNSMVNKEIEDDRDQEIDSTEEDDSNKSNTHRARILAKDDGSFFAIGVIGALLSGLVFPACGILFAYTIELLYRPVFGCDIKKFPSCDSIANEMQELSFSITYGWLGILGSALIGNTLLFYGFGTASERMNKRVRNAAFSSLIRQEVEFFDKRTVGSITSQLQDDAAKIHSFSGEPVRTFFIGISSLLVGLVISFIFMWPFALLVLAITPFLAFGAKMKMKTFYGEDEDSESDGGKNSPGGIVVETLLNMRTVASLNIEKVRSKEYAEALRIEDPTPIKSNLKKGLSIGLGQIVQQWGLALMFWWGGWLLSSYWGIWSFRDFLISMFSLMVSVSGMTFGTQGATDKEEATMAAKRIFSLIDRQSAIDPLSDKGRTG